MKNISKAVMTFALLAGLFMAYAAPANAQQATQNNTVNVNCSTGAYGQSVNCPVTTNQVINQNVNTQRRNLFHDTTRVNTGLDTTTVTASVVTLVTTAGGALITLKSKISK